MTSNEEERIESWHIERFIDLGFDWSAVSNLIAWKVDPHDVDKLMRRDGKPTSCTHELALRILQPDDDVVVLAEPELALA